MSQIYKLKKTLQTAVLVELGTIRFQILIKLQLIALDMRALMFCYDTSEAGWAACISFIYRHRLY